MKTAVRLLGSVALLIGSLAIAQSTYITGHINDVSSVPAGFVFHLDSGLPGNCTSAYQGWFYIPNGNTAMIALALLSFQNGSSVTVYAGGIDSGTGFCKLEAFDPSP